MTPVIIYDSFDLLTDEQTRGLPPEVFKYRNWKEDNHKNVLLKNRLWFPHPFDLNDPRDVRPDTVFDNTEFCTQQYFEKLLANAPKVYPSIKSQEKLFDIASRMWEYTKAHPGSIKEEHKKRKKVRKNYDFVGILSTAKNAISDFLWNEYGDGQKGYCIGFDTQKLCNEIKGGFGNVKYQDEPYKYSFINKTLEAHIETLYLKKKKFMKEEEFRFIALKENLNADKNRLKTFTNDAVTQIILGAKMKPEHQKEIIDFVNMNYSDNLPLYKIHIDENGAIEKKLVVRKF